MRVINVHFLATTLARALCPHPWSHFHTASFTSVCVILKIVRTATFQKGPVLLSSFRRDSSRPHRNKAISCEARVCFHGVMCPQFTAQAEFLSLLRGPYHDYSLELFTMCMSIRNILFFLISCRVKTHTSLLPDTI